MTFKVVRISTCIEETTGLQFYRHNVTTCSVCCQCNQNVISSALIYMPFLGALLHYSHMAASNQHRAAACLLSLTLVPLVMIWERRVGKVSTGGLGYRGYCLFIFFSSDARWSFIRAPPLPLYCKAGWLLASKTHSGWSLDFVVGGYL